MSKQHPIILYTGTSNRKIELEAIAQTHAWYLVESNELMQLLAYYVFYMPDVILIEDEPDIELAEDAFMHLSSVKAHPMIILSDDPARWEVTQLPSVVILPRNVHRQTLVDMILRLVNPPRAIAV